MMKKTNLKTGQLQSKKAFVNLLSMRLFESKFLHFLMYTKLCCFKHSDPFFVHQIFFDLNWFPVSVLAVHKFSPI